MTTRYFVDHAINCLIVRHSGVIMVDDITTLHGDVVKNDGFRRNMNILRDMRDAQMSDEFKYSSFKAWAVNNLREINVKLGNCRVAWVVGSRGDYIRAHRITHIFRFKHSSVEIEAYRKLESEKNGSTSPTTMRLIYCRQSRPNCWPNGWLPNRPVLVPRFPFQAPRFYCVRRGRFDSTHAQSLRP